MYLYRKAQREREKVEELRIITEERNARNAELQRRIELKKLAKLKKKKQEEVPKTRLSTNLSKRKQGGRGGDPVDGVGGARADRDRDEQGVEHPETLSGGGVRGVRKGEEVRL